MTDVSWVLFQVFIIFLKYPRKNGLCLIFCIYAASSLPSAWAGQRMAAVHLESSQREAGNGLRRTEAEVDAVVHHVKGLKGSFAQVGSAKNAHGYLHPLPWSECGDEDDAVLSSKGYRDWVGLLHYPYRDTSNQSSSNATDCLTVMDRVKKAMMFGASAIIILVLNPRVMKELDIAQLLSRPVVLIQSAENITTILNVLISQLSLKVRIACSGASQEDPQHTVTVWSSCWRARPGSGVVCHSDRLGSISKTDPGHYWNYFFSALATMILLMVLKAKGRNPDHTDDFEHVEQSVHRLARQALAMMQVKRYQTKQGKKNYNDSERDTCAICLDLFHPRQKIRVLPCLHEYHTKCVDPWLIRQRTCPLCKLDVVDKQLQEGNY